MLRQCRAARARLVWSWLGPRLSGYRVSDAENWHTAIDVILRNFEETEGFKPVLLLPGNPVLGYL